MDGRSEASVALRPVHLQRLESLSQSRSPRIARPSGRRSREACLGGTRGDRMTPTDRGTGPLDASNTGEAEKLSCRMIKLSEHLLQRLAHEDAHSLYNFSVLPWRRIRASIRPQNPHEIVVYQAPGDLGIDIPQVSEAANGQANVFRPRGTVLD